MGIESGVKAAVLVGSGVGIFARLQDGNNTTQSSIQRNQSFVHILAPCSVHNNAGTARPQGY